jgi:membrane protein required for colicin V production
MAWQNPNWVDYSIVVLIFLSALVSLLRGFVREALALAIWVAAFWVALSYATALADTPLFDQYLHANSLRLGVAFMVLLIATLIVGAMVNFLCSRLVEATGLSGTDRILGVLFGVVRGVLLVAVILLAAQMMSWSRASWWQNSRLIPQFQGLMAWLQGFVPAEFSMKLLNPKEEPTPDNMNDASVNTSSQPEQ